MDGALRPAAGVEIPVSAVRWRFDTSGGPGGQHANRSNTRAEATLDLTAVDLPTDIKSRLVNALGAEVRVVVDETRSQTRNRELALERLEEKLAAPLRSQTKRRKTRPSRSAKRRRMDFKRRRGDLKRSRRKPSADD
jgi:ribosome-associated protein